MKKLITIMSVLALVAGVSFAGITESMENANSLVEQNMLPEAIEAYETVLTDYPDAPVETLAFAQRRIGNLLARQNKFSDAIAAYEKTIADYPDAPVEILVQAQRRIGNLLEQQGKLSEAIEAYEKTVMDYPEAPVATLADSQRRIGNLLERQGKRPQAVEAYEKALADYPDAPVELLANTHRSLGYTLWKLSKLADAQAALEKFVAYYPYSDSRDVLRVKREVAELLVRQGKFAEAQAAYEKLIADYPTAWNAPEDVQADMRKWLGRALKRQGKIVEADEAFESMLQYGASVRERYMAEYADVIKDAPLDAIFRIVMSEDWVKPLSFVDAIAERLNNDCLAAIRRTIREQGGTFVGEEAKALIESLLAPVALAANAPALEGMEAALAACGIEIAPLDRTFVRSRGKRVADRIMMGETEATETTLAHVYIALGYDLFQAWLQVYNEGGTFEWPY